MINKNIAKLVTYGKCKISVVVSGENTFEFLLSANFLYTAQLGFW